MALPGSGPGPKRGAMGRDWEKGSDGPTSEECVGRYFSAKFSKWRGKYRRVFCVTRNGNLVTVDTTDLKVTNIIGDEQVCVVRASSGPCRLHGACPL